MDHPFEDGFLKFHQNLKNRGFNVLTVVTRSDLELPFVAGSELDGMKNTLRSLARADCCDGRDFRRVVAPGLQVIFSHVIP